MKNYLFTLTLISSLIIMLIINCNNSPNMTSYVFPYKLHDPEQKLILPDVLREISGITLTDLDNFACVNDEMGVVYIYSISENSVLKQFSFADSGDYEDITRVENSLYVLRSDGVITEIMNFNSEGRTVKSYSTQIPAKNNEGLCYDEKNHRLLIACKSKSGTDKGAKDFRAVWGFDITEKKLSEKPIYLFELKAIREFASQKDIVITNKSKDDNTEEVQEIKMKSSAISIHPVTEDIYILSASEFLLFVIDKLGVIKHIEPLDKQLFKKAEGLTFYPNGDMLISNEGVNEKPSIYIFKYN